MTGNNNGSSPVVEALKKLWQGWKRVARKVGDFQARVILVVFYFVVVAPFALAVRWGADPLAVKLRAPRGWQPKKNPDLPPMARAARLF